MRLISAGNGDGGFGEVLYSLREQVNRNDSVFWKPHLTFIVKNGFLGESKGFANQKPAEKYHPYIAIFCWNRREGFMEGDIYPKIILNF